MTTDLAYDATGRLAEIKHGTVVTHGYTYDDSNRLTSYDNSLDGVVNYTYDNRGQLTGADYVGDFETDESYAYDDNGNRTTVTNDDGSAQGYTTGDDNRLTGDGTYNYLYDAEGNRTARFQDNNSNDLLDSGDTDITEYEWDHRNRLTKVTDRATFGGTSNQEVDHTYDAFNRWIKRDVDTDGGTGSDPIEQTFFLYEQGQVHLQFDKTGSGNVADSDLSHRYLWGPTVDMLLADEHVDSLTDATQNENLWALTDHLGSFEKPPRAGVFQIFSIGGASPPLDSTGCSSALPVVVEVWS